MAPPGVSSVLPSPQMLEVLRREGAQALADIERLGVELVEGAALTVCHDGGDKNPTWLVVEGLAHFDPEPQAWQIGYTMDDCHWERRQS